ncbi:MAG: methyltransferase domain-containing protein [Vicinamibacterales bacterium]
MTIKNPTSPQATRTPWDAYAPFYDWENARTLGRRDLPFWRDVVRREGTAALELGCGTGRLIVPMARAGLPMTGIDLAERMLARARARVRRIPRARRPGLVRGDIRRLPFPDRRFGAVLASYGMLQSLLRDADLNAVLDESARVLRPGGLLGVDLVPDLARWEEYGREERLRGPGPGGGVVTLVEAVRQDRRRRLTIFDEEFIERRGRTVRRHRFSLTFRSLTMRDTIGRIERAGFDVEAVLGDYRGAAWDERADVWIVLARRRRARPRPLPRGGLSI